MSEASRRTTIFCNGAAGIGKRKPPKDALHLNYRGKDPMMKLLLPDFVRGVSHLPERVLDLLEIAAYVFAADRSVHRGEKNAVEFHGWSRSMRMVIRVRDHEFWRQQHVQEKLIAALVFMSGDRYYEFTFQPGHSTPVADLFDNERFPIAPKPGMRIALFSGGLDSLAGVVEALADPSVFPCLVSHQSGQTGTARTQNQLVEALELRYPKRLSHYKFRCGLQSERAAEETQRTRPFLYASTAFALAHALKIDQITAYENGVTAMNFARRADLFSARASRTAHPKTIALMQEFLSEVLGREFRIETPFVWKTKADVVKLLADRGEANLITSAVSCSKTFQNLGQAPQCGGCSQCIDRRFASHAVDLHDVDHPGLYALDFLKHMGDDMSVRTTLVDYVRQAKNFDEWNIDYFQTKLLAELTDIIGYVGHDEEGTLGQVYALCKRHGQQVATAIQKMQQKYDHPFRMLPEGSFLKMIGDRDHLVESRFDYAGLMARLEAVVAGDAHATAYEHVVREILEAVFQPDLVNGRPQQGMDDNRKRIDIVFDNKAGQGFFAGLRDTHKRYCPWIAFECKNYSHDIENPEFSQLRDRLGGGKSEVGFIVCRKVENCKAILKQCQDRSSGVLGGIFILVLEDSDLRLMLTLRAKGQLAEITKHLDDRLRDILFKT